MTARLLLDENVQLDLAVALRNRGFDVLHVQEVDRKGRSDPEQLLLAVQQERCILTFNIKDFVPLHNSCVTSNQEHWGIILSEERPIGELLRRTLFLLTTTSAEALKNQIHFL
jgi:predicted nuclease of predicted toxin-antitoxin system